MVVKIKIILMCGFLHHGGFLLPKMSLYFGWGTLGENMCFEQLKTGDLELHQKSYLLTKTQGLRG